MRGLFRWAVDMEIAKVDPTRDVKLLNVKSEGFHVWTEERYRGSRRDGRLVHESGLPSTSCSIPACAAAMRCALDASTSRTACSELRQRRTASSSRRRSCRRWPAQSRPRRPVILLSLRASAGGRWRRSLRQLVSRGVQGGWRSRFGSRPSQGRGDSGGRERRDHDRAKVNVRLDRRLHAGALHEDGGQGEICGRRHVEIGTERARSIPSPSPSPSFRPNQIKRIGRRWLPEQDSNLRPFD